MHVLVSAQLSVALGQVFSLSGPSSHGWGDRGVLSAQSPDRLKGPDEMTSVKGSRQIMGSTWGWCQRYGQRAAGRVLSPCWSLQAELQQKVEENERLRLELQMVETERVRLSLLEEKLVDVLQLLQRLRDLVGSRELAQPGQGEELLEGGPGLCQAPWGARVSSTFQRQKWRLREARPEEGWAL